MTLRTVLFIIAELFLLHLASGTKLLLNLSPQNLWIFPCAISFSEEIRRDRENSLRDLIISCCNNVCSFFNIIFWKRDDYYNGDSSHGYTFFFQECKQPEAWLLSPSKSLISRKRVIILAIHQLRPTITLP